MVDEYELTPHKQLEQLKKEVEELRKNPFGKNSGSHDMLSAVEKLTRSIDQMNGIFKGAVHELKEGSREEKAEKRDPLSKKLDKLIDQNKKIAEGIISVAKMLSEGKIQHEPAPVYGMPRSRPPEIDFPEQEDIMPAVPPGYPGFSPQMRAPPPGPIPGGPVDSLRKKGFFSKLGK
ncbi:MAG: hypothetical protein ABH879_08520 [archaeon]